MENFLPALLIIGAVIYKIYSEYQKEQEKARKRMPSTPPPPVADGKYPQPTVIEPTISLPTPPPTPTIPKMERRVDIPEEVKRTRQRREAAALRSNQKTVVKPVVDLEEENEGTVSFDLREAVIQSAILNRPY